MDTVGQRHGFLYRVRRVVGIDHRSCCLCSVSHELLQHKKMFSARRTMIAKAMDEQHFGLWRCYLRFVRIVESSSAQ